MLMKYFISCLQLTAFCNYFRILSYVLSLSPWAFYWHDLHAPHSLLLALCTDNHLDPSFGASWAQIFLSHPCHQGCLPQRSLHPRSLNFAVKPCLTWKTRLCSTQRWASSQWNWRFRASYFLTPSTCVATIRFCFPPILHFQAPPRCTTTHLLRTPLGLARSRWYCWSTSDEVCPSYKQRWTFFRRCKSPAASKSTNSTLRLWSDDATRLSKIAFSEWIGLPKSAALRILLRGLAPPQRVPIRPGSSSYSGSTLREIMTNYGRGFSFET